MKLAICYGGLDQPQTTIQYLLDNEADIVETSPTFFLNSEDDVIASTAEMFRKKGIHIRSIHAPFGVGCNLSDPDDEKRNVAIQTHLKVLHKAAQAEVELVVIHPGVGGYSSQEDMEKANLVAFESISQLIEKAEETGVDLALENMPPNHPGYEIRQIMEPVEKINSPALGVCFDSGHAHICGNMREFMEAVGERMICIHMQDNDGTKDMHLQPPYGTTDWSAFVDVLKEVDYRYPITIETRPWAGSSYKQMLREVSAVLESPEDTLLRCRKCGHAVLRSNKQWFCNCIE